MSFRRPRFEMEIVSVGQESGRRTAMLVPTSRETWSAYADQKVSTKSLMSLSRGIPSARSQRRWKERSTSMQMRSSSHIRRI